MSLKTIIGQERPVAILQGILGRQRVASAYLFSGEQGIGKKTAALNVAKAINCLGSDAASSRTDSCDECPSCRKIDAGSHPDVLLVTPEDRQIRIEDIRAVDDAVSFKPFEGRRKIVIIDDADMMNAPAANAFLKTLEEPPGQSTIILVSSRPDLLLPTIRSRCTRIHFRTLSDHSCREVLRRTVPDETPPSVERLSMGRPGLAISGDLVAERKWFLDLFHGMMKGEKDGWASREEMDRWIESLLILLRDLTVYKISGETSRMINADIGDTIAGLAAPAATDGILRIYAGATTLKGLLIYNPNKSVTWNYLGALIRGGMAV